jgi:GGDEF domain-containing protein
LIRFGGDEFLCALPGARADTLQRTFEAISQNLVDDPDGAGISFGVAELAPDDSVHELIERAYARLSEGRRRRRASDHHRAREDPHAELSPSEPGRSRELGRGP